MMTAMQTTCSACGKELPPDAPRGLCPVCLFQLDEPIVTESADQTDAPTAGFASSTRRFGDYELLQEIARGGMGIVYRARQVSLDRIVVVKMILFGSLANVEQVRRFRIEASAAGSLQHPNIVAVHEVGLHDGQNFMVMDYVDGPNLARLVQDQPMPAKKAASYLKVIAEAVQFAHTRGILHRDLKPSNVLIGSDDRPRVTDFGLAKRFDTESSLTLSGHVIGSPNYLPPEQAGGGRHKVGHASDVYSLGAILYHLLTARPPFRAETIAETLAQVQQAEPLAPRLLNPSVPRDLETICLKCLEKEPSKRYATAQALADELDRYLNNEPIQARPVSRPERAWRWCRRKPVIASLAATSAVLLSAVLIGGPIAVFNINHQKQLTEAEALTKYQNLYAADMHLAEQALAEDNLAHALELLNKYRPSGKSQLRNGKSEVDLRGFEWRYLWKLCRPDEKSVIKGSSGERHITFSADGKFLAKGHTVWDAKTEQVVKNLPQDTAIAFSPVQPILATSGGGSIKLWNTETWRATVLLRDDEVAAVAFSKDGEWMATGGAAIRLWHWDGAAWSQAASQPAAFMSWHNGKTLAFSPDSRIVVSGYGPGWGNRVEVNLWSVPALEKLPDLMNSPTDAGCITFSPDGERLVISCWDGRIRLWDVATRNELASEMKREAVVIDVCFSPTNGNILASLGAYRVIRLWDFSTQKPLVTLRDPVGLVWGMSFAPDGQSLATAGPEGTDIAVKLWDANKRKPDDILIHSGPQTLPLAISRDSQTLATINREGKVKFWNLSSKEEVTEKALTVDFAAVDTFEMTSLAVALTPDLKTLAIGTTNGSVELWDLSQKKRTLLAAHNVNVRAVTFSGDGNKLATVGFDGEVIVWDTATWRRQAAFKFDGTITPISKGGVLALSFSLDGQLLAMGSGDTFIVWDVVSKTALHRFDGQNQVCAIKISPNGKMLATSHVNPSFDLWNLSDGSRLASLRGHLTTLSGFCFSPDGGTLVTTADHVRLWNVATRQEVASFTDHEKFTFASLFSPDGNTLVSADYGGTVRLWRAPSFAEIETAEKLETRK